MAITRKTRHALFLLSAATLISGECFARDQRVSCESLISQSLPNTTITLAATVPAGTNPVPQITVFGLNGPLDRAVCRVAGVITPTSVSHIEFEVWMPINGWNGKFNGVGGAGLSGFVNYQDMQTALGRGYATASTDTGHEAFLLDGSWMQGQPELVKDFAWRSHHLTALAAKSIIAAYYGKPASHAYFTGCSNGGEEGLSEAQRFPDDYEGIVAGAPANYPTHMWPGEVYPSWVAESAPQGLIDKLNLVQGAAIAACDANDGLVDGLIDDPRTCGFDPATIQCAAGDAPTCLTAPQVDWVRKIYAGLHDPSTGDSFWPGYYPGSEAGWGGHISPGTMSPPLSYFKYLIFGDPSWYYTSFDFSDPNQFAVIPAADKAYASVLDAINPDLSGFRNRGGKIILYHGWADQNIAPLNTVTYYGNVVATMGGKGGGAAALAKTKSFARLFMAPGMQHCGGGIGPNTFDALGALEAWVEHGKAPQQLIASHSNAAGVVDRTRPLCTYPKTAIYSGHGSIDDAANFRCENPSGGDAAQD